MKINKENFSLKITVAVTYLIMILVNALANILPINGLNTGEISDSYPNLFAPAGITFAIWGVIYFLLLAYVIYQFGIFQKKPDPQREELFKKLGIPFSISSVLNSIWIFAWHYRRIELSLFLIIGVLICLVLINHNTKKSKNSFKGSSFVRITFSIYFGWVTVATIANVTTALVKIGLVGSRTSEVFWTIIILIIGTLISIAILLRNNDFFFGLVIIWAYVGIYIKHTSSSYFNGQYQSVIAAIVVCLVFLVLSTGSILFPNRKKLFCFINKR